MRRRTFLRSVAAGSALLSGCSSGGDEGSNPVQTERDTPAAQSASVEIVSSEYILADSVVAPPDSQIPWAITEVQNSTPIDHGRIRTELRFYDSSDSLLEVRDGYTGYLPAQTTWRNYTRYYTETPDQLERVELHIVDTDPDINGNVIEQASVANSDMVVEPEAGVDVVGEIDLGNANPDRVTVFALVYDSQGRLRGTMGVQETNPAQTVAYSRSTISIRTPPNLPEEAPSSFEFVVLNGFV
jgi:hypothetical protein